MGGNVGRGLAQSTGSKMGVAGLTSPVQKKGEQTIGATMIDPQQSIDYFNKAAKQQVAGIREGLSFYKDSLDQAAKVMRSGYAQANATLKPLSYASTAALNEQMRMLGMDPLPATSGMADQFKSAITEKFKDVNKIPGMQDRVNSVYEQMKAAEALKDPAQRLQAKEQIATSFADLQGALAPHVNDLTTQLKNGPEKQAIPSGGKGGNKGQPAGFSGFDKYTPKAKIDAVKQKNKEAQVAWDNNLPNFSDQVALAQAGLDELSNFAQDFTSTYSENYDQGYTGQQVIDKIQAQPGWENQMQAGTQAIARQAAAGGLLTSGNTGTALINYGQAQANSFFNNYMGYLSNVYNEGANATGQISQNQINEAGYMANNYASWGQAQNTASTNIGTARSNASNLIGTTLYNASVFNATAQNNLQNAMVASQNGVASAAIAAAPGMMNAQTNAGMLDMAKGNASLANASAISGALGGSGSGAYNTPQQNWNNIG